MQCIASSVVFVAMETRSNNSPSSSGALRERAQRNPAQQMGRLRLSGVMSQYHNKMFSGDI
jgi:hypothetical protein